MGSSDEIAGLSLACLMGPSSVSRQFVGNGVSYDAHAFRDHLQVFRLGDIATIVRGFWKSSPCINAR